MTGALEQLPGGEEDPLVGGELAVPVLLGLGERAEQTAGCELVELPAHPVEFVAAPIHLSILATEAATVEPHTRHETVVRTRQSIGA